MGPLPEVLHNSLNLLKDKKLENYPCNLPRRETSTNNGASQKVISSENIGTKDVLDGDFTGVEIYPLTGFEEIPIFPMWEEVG